MQICFVRFVFTGYGNLAPKTPEGKLVTMLYALVGVPLMLLCLSNLGALLAGTFQFAYSHACCYACAKNYHPQHKEPDRGHHLHYQQQCKNQSAAYGKAKFVSELPKELAIPVVPPKLPSVHASALSRGPRLHNHSRPPRHLAPDVRKILTECAEYSVAQASDPAAAKLLRELQQDPEIGNTSAANDGEEEEDDEELEDADQEQR
jgi:hypothetical protein